jgi:ankyrin repeat protein
LYTAINKHKAVVKLLLNTGKVKADLGDSNSKTLLLHTAKNEHKAVVKLLLDTGKVNANSKNISD